MNTYLERLQREFEIFLRQQFLARTHVPELSYANFVDWAKPAVMATLEKEAHIVENIAVSDKNALHNGVEAEVVTSVLIRPVK